MIDKDKLLERDRYDASALAQMSKPISTRGILLGSQTMVPYLQSPYILYEQKVAELIRSDEQVLELGSGSGLHTRILLESGASVTASDISPTSLMLLSKRLSRKFTNLKTEVADMENLPFDASSFDSIIIVGSLSYGEPALVDSEIRRVLRSGGKLICVDSLNHNPIYRLNRLLHHLRGNRSKSTLKRMPDIARINALAYGFSNVSVHYFGALSFAMPLFARLFGDAAAKSTSDRVDHMIDVRRSAFKFVLVAEGCLK